MVSGSAGVVIPSGKRAIGVIKLISICSALILQILIAVGPVSVIIGFRIIYSGITAFASDISVVIPKIETASICGRGPDKGLLISVDVKIVYTVTVNIAAEDLYLCGTKRSTSELDPLLVAA